MTITVLLSRFPDLLLTCFLLVSVCFPLSVDILHTVAIWQKNFKRIVSIEIGRSGAGGQYGEEHCSVGFFQGEIWGRQFAREKGGKIIGSGKGRATLCIMKLKVQSQFAYLGKTP